MTDRKAISWRPRELVIDLNGSGYDVYSLTEGLKSISSFCPDYMFEYAKHGTCGLLFSDFIRSNPISEDVAKKVHNVIRKVTLYQLRIAKDFRDKDYTNTTTGVFIHQGTQKDLYEQFKGNVTICLETRRLWKNLILRRFREVRE